MSGLVEVARFPWVYEAELARAYLESYGLHAVVFDVQSNLYADGALVGVRVMVLDDDLDEARGALSKYKS